MPRPDHLLPVLIFSCLALPYAGAAQEVVDLEVINVEADTQAGQAWADTSINAADLEAEYQGAGLDTVLRAMPGVTTQGGTADGGEMAVNIRGLQDNGRVAVTIDGMRQNFSRAGHSAEGTFSVDTEMLRDVTVSRGAGAKAGAVGGAVALRTVRAQDLLTDPDDAMGGEFRLRYGTRTKTPTVHGALAARLSEALDLTVAGTQSELKDYTAPDGTKVYGRQDTSSALASLGVNTDNGQRFTFTASQMDKDYYTGLNGGIARDNDLRTTSYSLGYEAEDILGGWTINGSLYNTETKVRQQPVDATLVPSGAPRSYRSSTTGLLLEASRYFDIAGHAHDLSLTLEGFRDTVKTNDPSGSLTPSGNRELWSLGVQDRIDLGRASLTLGLTADAYNLDSENGRASGQALSPRIALDVPLGDVTLHAAAAMGYRYPSLSETLVSGLHPEPADFEIRPNAALDPERFRSFELGMSYARTGLFNSGDMLELRATAFHNRLSDYIELLRVGGVFDSYYQYDNVDNVRIVGLELQADYETGRFFSALSGQIMRGANMTDGTELTRVPPNRLVLTAGLRSADARRELGARFTTVGSKSGQLASASWKTVDLFLTQKISEKASFGLSLNNIFDKTYTPHLETQPSPGFNAQASIIVRF